MENNERKMKNFDDFDENYIEIREQELSLLTNEDLLEMFGKGKLFLGDITNEASAVACDIDIDVRIIRKILLERLNGKGGENNDKNIKKLN